MPRSTPSESGGFKDGEKRVALVDVPFHVSAERLNRDRPRTGASLWPCS